MGTPNRAGFDSVVAKSESTEYDFGLGLKIMMMGGNHRNPNDEIASTVDYSGDRSNTSYENFGAVAANNWGGKLFTASQRQELERQKIIYKYMAASVPVPSELLIPVNCRYPSNDLPSVGGKAALDQEPWRCRRTDGKKWRCAREAAPDQKYCERHSHKTRPGRSRKLVESSSASLSPSNPTRRINTTNNTNKVISSSTSSVSNPANYNNNNNKPGFGYQTSPPMFMSQQQQQQYSNSRYPYWFMKREAQHTQEIATTEPTLSSFFGLDQITSTTTSNVLGNDQNDSPLPRQFLNAWSIGQKSEPEHDSSSLLTLSMAGGDGGGGGVHQEDGGVNVQLGIGGTILGNDWMCSTGPGGPLAEALWADVSDSDGGSHGLGFMK